ncbi:MAG: hypothetical protein LWX07_08180 [Bacteroidetes bacterium]|nr:hypothetical protein [Bacteroidota bacterium]
MFDYFHIIDFTGKQGIGKKISFLSNPFYKNIDAVEYVKEYENSFAVFLEREKTENNYAEFNGVCLFLYGTVYTNKRHMERTGEKPRIIYASTLYKMYAENGDGFTDFIKGSFVITIFDRTQNTFKVITDRLNVLPLYYYYGSGALIISSSVRIMLETELVPKTPDYAALAEQLIFDFTLGTKTYFKEIKRTDNGTIYNFSASEKSETRYWSVERLYNKKLLPRKKSLELLSAQLRENANLYCSDTGKVLVALTGGFDGRANLALLDRSKEDFLCYSYGMPDSTQVSIPRKICGKLDLSYEPVLLDERYEKEHDECALEVVEFSNGTAPVMRSNYTYAYRKLKSFSSVNLMGLFGSEVMRPLHNVGIMVNYYSEKLFLSDNPSETLDEIFEDIKKKNYIAAEIIDGSTQEIKKEILSEYFKKYNAYGKVLGFFFFILQEGVRKYFMQEIQVDRVYVTARFPFFDDDFVELMYKTPFAGMYNGFLGKSKFKRRKGQLLYAHIYRKFRPELGKIRLDRGYRPDDLLKPFPFNFLSLYKGVKEAAAYKRAKGNDTFNPEKWTSGLISDILQNTHDKTGIFGSGLKDKFADKSYLKDLLKYCHVISIYKYMNPGD